MSDELWALEAKRWRYRVRGKSEWISLGETTSFLCVHTDQAATEAAKDHWRRVGQFSQVELTLRDPVGSETFWLIATEQRWSFLPVKRTADWDVDVGS